MSKLWSPHQVYSKISLWLDGNDPNGNNSHGLPDEGLAYDSWKDKSRNKVSFSAYPFSQFNNPEFVIEQIAELSVSGGAGYDNSSSTAGKHFDIELAPVSPSAGSGKVFVSYTVVSGAVTQVTSISGNHGYKVGDTLLEVVDQNSGGTNCVYTVAKLHKKGAIVSGGQNGNGLLDSLESEVLSRPLGSYLRVVFAANIRARGMNGVSFIGLDDTSGDRDVYFCEDQSVANKVGIGVKYRGSTGQLHTFMSQFDENVPHIVSVTLDADGFKVHLDGVSIFTPVPYPDPVLPQSTYRWTIFNNVNTNPHVTLKSAGMLHEMLAFNQPLSDEDSNALYGYLSQKYHIPLNSFARYYEATAYANSLFSGANKLSPRRPVQVVKMYLDFCDNVYGQTSFGQSGRSNCTASGAAGSECYNTRHTCQDLTNYRLSTNGKKTYTFTSEVGDTLTGQLPNAHPCLMKVTSAPVEIKPTKGVSVRGSINIQLRDFLSTGSDSDPYAATRNIIALENGTFFQKLVQRNPHYINRPIEIYDGYIDYAGYVQIYDGKKEYIIDSMQLSKDTCSIKCKDPMSLADELKAKVPAPSFFSLADNIPVAGTHSHIDLRYDGLPIDKAVAADVLKVTDYFGANDATGFIRINDEIMGYTVHSDSNHCAIDISSRAQWGTLQPEDIHEGDTDDDGEDQAGDTVQKCLVYGEYDGSGAAQTINDVAYQLLVNEAGVPAKAVNNETGGVYSWNDEKQAWLQSYRLDVIFSEPKEVNKQLSQLGTMVGVNFFYDDATSQIVMKAETPELNTDNIVTITDDLIIEDSMKISISEKERVSRVYYYYNMRNHTGDRDKPKNFRNLYIAVDSDGELDVEYGKQSSKTIFGYGVTDTSTATSVSQRILSRFKNTPKTIEFSIDASFNTLQTGDHFYLNTKEITDFNGIPQTAEFQVLSVQFDAKKTLFKIKAKQFRFTTINTAGIAADNVGAFSTGGGTGTEIVPYTGVRASNSFMADENHITLQLVEGGTGFTAGQTIEFTPNEAQYGAAANTRNLAITYTLTGSTIASIASVSSNVAALGQPTTAHSGYVQGDELVGTSSSGSGLRVRVTKSAKMSGGQESYSVA